MTSLSFVSLCLLAIMVSTASAIGGIGNCCRKFGNNHIYQIHRDMLKEYYTEHSASCPLQAVVFTTMRGRRLCSDPAVLWTQTSMAYLDGKNWQKQNATRSKRHL